MSDLTWTALLAKIGLLDNDGQPTNNDLDPTKSMQDDFDDWWTGLPEPWEAYADLIVDDPLLGVLLGAPHEVIMPAGCSRPPKEKP